MQIIAIILILICVPVIFSAIGKKEEETIKQRQASAPPKPIRTVVGRTPQKTAPSKKRKKRQEAVKKAQKSAEWQKKSFAKEQEEDLDWDEEE